MHPTMPRNRFCASVTVSLLFAAAGALGAVVHRAKSDETSLFRTRLLEPPPLTRLSEGDAVATITETLEPDGDYIVNVHPSPTELDVIVSCGELVKSSSPEY